MPAKRPALLLIDPDDAHAHLLGTALRDLATLTRVATVREMAEVMHAGPFDHIWVDPRINRDVRSVVVGIRRQNPTTAYVAIIGGGEDLDPLTVGANDFVPKPVGGEAARELFQNGQHLLSLLRRLNNPDDDFPSTRGVIAKSAFAQLFMAALDRADRYGERSQVLSLRLLNADQIRVQAGDYAAHTTGATLAFEIARLRRQSDILAQIGPHEYALLLQRPMFDTEPVEAALRFADTLSSSTALATATDAPIAIGVMLMDIPSGAILTQHDLDVRR